MRRASLVLVALAASHEAQTFVVDNSLIPSGGPGHRTEDIEFGDIDSDGDFDVAEGAGGENLEVQNRLWINAGGIQGGQHGAFLNETAARFPMWKDKTFEIDLVDIDADADLDVHVSNTWWAGSDTNRWWINQGGLQGAVEGYFADETATTWVGLGQPGSSIDPFFLNEGSFVDTCHGTDFGDLDHDGDLDLVHTSYFQPTRIFLNDGAGHFQEFNPSGFMPNSVGLLEGDPGLWCEGLQFDQTLDVGGTFCDIKTYAEDLELFDVDGDFDVDLLLSERMSKKPRFFANRLEGSGLVAGAGVLAFRDVTELTFGMLAEPDTAPRGEDLGDLDGDGDLDIFGADWASVLPWPVWDAACENLGGGFFGPGLTVAGSEVTHYEVDLIDVDGDGDLDAVTAGDSTLDLFFNVGELNFELDTLFPFSGASNTAAVADTDGDGDFDVLVGKFLGDDYYVNVTQVPDGQAPTLPLMETLGDAPAAASIWPVRAHVLDNAPIDLVRFYPAQIEVTVEGIRLPACEARWCGGQVFAGDLPGNLVGAVSYRMTALDDWGNQGASGTHAYSAWFAASFQASYGSATSGMLGGSPELRALSVPFGTSTLYLALSSGAGPGTPVWLGIAAQKLEPALPIPGLLLLQAGGQVLYTATGILDASGDVVFAVSIPAVPPGASAFAQGFVLDPTAAGDLLASSHGLELVTQ